MCPDLVLVSPFRVLLSKVNLLTIHLKKKYILSFKSSGFSSILFLSHSLSGQEPTASDLLFVRSLAFADCIVMVWLSMFPWLLYFV